MRVKTIDCLILKIFLPSFYLHCTVHMRNWKSDENVTCLHDDCNVAFCVSTPSETKKCDKKYDFMHFLLPRFYYADLNFKFTRKINIFTSFFCKKQQRRLSK